MDFNVSVHWQFSYLPESCWKLGAEASQATYVYCTYVKNQSCKGQGPNKSAQPAWTSMNQHEPVVSGKIPQGIVRPLHSFCCLLIFLLRGAPKRGWHDGTLRSTAMYRTNFLRNLVNIWWCVLSCHFSSLPARWLETFASFDLQANTIAGEWRHKLPKISFLRLWVFQHISTSFEVFFWFEEVMRADWIGTSYPIISCHVCACGWVSLCAIYGQSSFTCQGGFRPRFVRAIFWHPVPPPLVYQPRVESQSVYGVTEVAGKSIVYAVSFKLESED